MEQYIDEYLRNIFGEAISENKGIKIIKHLEIVSGSVAGTVLGAGILESMKYSSAVNKACSKFTEEKKTKCLSKYKAGRYHAEMLALKENSIICNESQDRDNCLRLVAMRIMELQKLISN